MIIFWLFYLPWWLSRLARDLQKTTAVIQSQSSGVRTNTCACRNVVDALSHDCTRCGRITYTLTEHHHE